MTAASHRGSSGNGRVGRDGRMVRGDTARMPAASQRRAAKAAQAPACGSERRPRWGPMPPELEAKLIAPDDMRLPDLGGLVDGATAVPLPGRHLEAVYYDTADLRLARRGHHR